MKTDDGNKSSWLHAICTVPEAVWRSSSQECLPKGAPQASFSSMPRTVIPYQSKDGIVDRLELRCAAPTAPTALGVNGTSAGMSQASLTPPSVGEGLEGGILVGRGVAAGARGQTIVLHSRCRAALRPLQPAMPFDWLERTQLLASARSMAAAKRPDHENRC